MNAENVLPRRPPVSGAEWRARLRSAVPILNEEAVVEFVRSGEGERVGMFSDGGLRHSLRSSARYSVGLSLIDADSLRSCPNVFFKEKSCNRGGIPRAGSIHESVDFSLHTALTGINRTPEIQFGQAASGGIVSC